MFALFALAAPWAVSLLVVIALAVVALRRRRRWSIDFYQREAAHRARVAAEARARSLAAQVHAAELEALQDCAT